MAAGIQLGAAAHNLQHINHAGISAAISTTRPGTMKLIFCPHCRDIVKLRTDAHRPCWCGRSGGMYTRNGLDAIIDGDAVPIGIANDSFAEALENRPEKGIGTGSVAFVIPRKCPTVRKY